MIDRNLQMEVLKKKGYTYREIGEIFGISKQRAFQLCGQGNKSFFKPISKKQCIFAGIRNYMNNNEISISELLRKTNGENTLAKIATFRDYLNGKNDLPKRVIDNILKATQLTYEEAFIIKN